MLRQNTAEYTSISFRVPTVEECHQQQQPAYRLGELDKNDFTFVSPLNDENYDFAVSECPGDFRLPQSGTAPPSDPTLAFGCRNWKALFISASPRVSWRLFAPDRYSASTETHCQLEFGQPSDFNFILDGPADGVINASGASQGCLMGETVCGTGIRYRMF